MAPLGCGASTCAGLFRLPQMGITDPVPSRSNHERNRKTQKNAENGARHSLPFRIIRVHPCHPRLTLLLPELLGQGLPYTLLPDAGETPAVQPAGCQRYNRMQAGRLRWGRQDADATTEHRRDAREIRVRSEIVISQGLWLLGTSPFGATAGAGSPMWGKTSRNTVFTPPGPVVLRDARSR